MVYRPHIEVVDGIGRIKREAPPPRHHAGQIVIDIIMACNSGPVPHPEPRLNTGR
jgi:hypothetical protein